MKTSVRIAAILLLAFSASSVVSAQEWTKAQTKEWQICANSWKNWKAGNFDAIAAMVHPEYQGWDDQSSLPYSREKVIEQFKEWEEKTSLRSYDIEPARIVVTNNDAVIDYYLLSAQKDDTIPSYITKGKTLKIYKTWISLRNDPLIIKGVLYEVKDSSIIVSNPLVKANYYSGKLILSEINYNNINQVKIRRKNSVLAGALIGACTGFIAGGLIGLISGDDPPGFLAWTAEEKALIFGLPLAVGGASAGAIEASIRIKIPINGSSGNFLGNKSRLMKYTVR